MRSSLRSHCHAVRQISNAGYDSNLGLAEEATRDEKSCEIIAMSPDEDRSFVCWYCKTAFGKLHYELRFVKQSRQG